MKAYLAGAALAAAAVLASPVFAQEKLNLRVLYAGEKEHKRTGIWLEFLRKHCKGAEAIEMTTLSNATAKGFDVVMIDSSSPYKKAGIKLPRRPKLTRDFTRPTILLGAAGGTTVSPVNIKIDWL